METITASWKRTIFETQKNGICVGIYQVKELGKCLTLKGENLPNTKDVVYSITGEYINHPKYGKQFEVHTFTENTSSLDTIEKFLSSSLIKGIGKTIAKRIVDTFGEDTIHIMDTDIDRLLKIKGISPQKLADIKESYEKQRTFKDVIQLLGKKNITVSLARKVFEMFKEDTMTVIKETPYKMCYVDGISFSLADSFGSDTEEYELSHERFCVCAKYVLAQNENNAFASIIGERPSGSLGMLYNDFANVTYRLLKRKYIDKAFICQSIAEMLMDKKIVTVKQKNEVYVYDRYVFDMEEATANSLAYLRKKKPSAKVNVETEISKKYNYDSNQIKAIQTAFQNQISMIIGIPGSGKTTVINEIARIYKKHYPSNGMYFLAPTGRAASRIKDITKEPSANVSTIHSVLEIGVENKERSDVMIRKSLVVVDEVSMLDSRIARILFDSILDDCTVILCGDDEQLQSVGAGAVLRDLIDSGMIPVTVLDQIYRQDEKSVLFQNIKKIRKGDTNIEFNDTFSFTEESDLAAVEDKMVDLYMKKVKEYGMDNVMLLAPFNRYEAGVGNLNNRIQALINPSHYGEEMKGYCTFRVNDRVMQLVNDHDLKIMNGDVGVVTEIGYNKDGEKEMTVMFDKTPKKYTKDNIDEVTLGYAYTIHKSQGNESKCVIMCISNFHGKMLKRNLLYTGITRAKEEVYLFGQKEALNKCITTMDKDSRNTCLKALLQKKVYGL